MNDLDIQPCKVITVAVIKWPYGISLPLCGLLFQPLYLGPISRHYHFLPRDALLSAVYAVVVCLSVCLCVCVCVCVCVTLRYCIKTAKRRIMQITPHDSTLTPVF